MLPDDELPPPPPPTTKTDMPGSTVLAGSLMPRLNLHFHAPKVYNLMRRDYGAYDRLFLQPCSHLGCRNEVVGAIWTLEHQDSEPVVCLFATADSSTPCTLTLNWYVPFLAFYGHVADMCLERIWKSRFMGMPGIDVGLGKPRVFAFPGTFLIRATTRFSL